MDCCNADWQTDDDQTSKKPIPNLRIFTTLRHEGDRFRNLNFDMTMYRANRILMPVFSFQVAKVEFKVNGMVSSWSWIAAAAKASHYPTFRNMCPQNYSQ